MGVALSDSGLESSPTLESFLKTAPTGVTVGDEVFVDLDYYMEVDLSACLRKQEVPDNHREESEGIRGELYQMAEDVRTLIFAVAELSGMPLGTNQVDEVIASLNDPARQQKERFSEPFLERPEPSAETLKRVKAVTLIVKMRR